MRISVLSLALLAVISGACSTTSVLAPTTLSQAAQAEIKLKKGSNDNATGTLSVQFLAPPELLTPPRSAYSVWVRPKDGFPWQNMGQIKIGSSRSGTFALQAPYEQFDVIVTAEASATAVSPSELVVFRGTAAL